MSDISSQGACARSAHSLGWVYFFAILWLGVELVLSIARQIVLPSRLVSSQIQGAAKFRSKGRLPILSWLHPRTGTPICRSSQPYTGLAGRSSEDDMTFITAIRTSASIRNSLSDSPSPEEDDLSLKIFDARPKVHPYFRALVPR